MDFALIARITPFFLEAAIITLQVSAIALGLSLVLGAIATAGRLSRFRAIRWIASLYVSVFRGTPALVQLFLIYYGGPQIGLDLEPFDAGALGLGLNAGAYMSEAMRGAILTVDRGQKEAARSIGFSQGQSMWFIVLPQAARLMIRSLGVNAIMLLKGSSLVSTISVIELSYTAQRFIGSTYKPFEVFAVAAVIYMIIVYALSRSIDYLDQRYTFQ